MKNLYILILFCFSIIGCRNKFSQHSDISVMNFVRNGVLTYIADAKKNGVSVDRQAPSELGVLVSEGYIYNDLKVEFEKRGFKYLPPRGVQMKAVVIEGNVDDQLIEMKLDGVMERKEVPGRK